MKVQGENEKREGKNEKIASKREISKLPKIHYFGGINDLTRPPQLCMLRNKWFWMVGGGVEMIETIYTPVLNPTNSKRIPYH